MENAAFKRLMGRVQAGWPTRVLRDATLDEWWEALQVYPFAESDEAITRLLRRSKFFPSLADLVEQIDLVQREWALKAEEERRARQRQLPPPQSTPAEQEYTETLRKVMSAWSAGKLQRADWWPAVQRHAKHFATVSTIPTVPMLIEIRAIARKGGATFEGEHVDDTTPVPAGSGPGA